ncbi:MAG: response regulator [Deltaproteobacteria bacterium]|nr:response regulator [Deltaproteobacteria bacterium]
MARRSRRTPSGHTILVVDDDEGILTSVRALLEREGHEVLAASSGPRALELFKESDVHLILVDYLMPRMTGADLIREIRGFDPLVQIILHTGYAGERPPRQMLAELDIQGYHDKTRGPTDLLLWVDVGLKAHGLVRTLHERERLQAELVANVSHEFRTPLNVISGYADLLSDGEFGELEEQGKFPLNRIQEACRNLGHLVDDFLRYARLQARVEQVCPAQIETAGLVEEMERLAGVLVDAEKIRFRLDATRAPEVIFTDPVKLRTILRNLLTNAAKFTDEGEIELGFAPSSSGGLSIYVRDTGPGIPSEACEVIFEPFRQLDGSMTRAHGGIGLGLALSRKLAYLLGGELHVTSELGQGSIFTLILPPQVLEPRESPPAEPARAESGRASNWA